MKRAAVVPQPVKIGFWRTEPSKELATYKALSRPGRRLFKAMGFYDIITIDSTEADHKTSSINVLNHSELRCLDWFGDGRARKTHPLTVDHPWLTVTLVKLNPIRFFQAGRRRPSHLAEERQFISELDKCLQYILTDNECQHVVLGTAGWAEIVVVLTGNEADILAGAAIQFQRAVEDHHPSILKTETIWGIEHSFVATDRGRARLRRLRSTDVFPTMSVTYRAGERVARRVETEVERLFGGVPAIAFGGHDLEIRGEPGALGQFFDRLIEFRAKVGDCLYSTATGLHVRSSRFNDGPVHDDYARKDLDGLRETVKRLASKIDASLKGTTSPDISDVYTRLRSAFAAVRLPIGSDAVWDMIPALTNLSSDPGILNDPEAALPLAETLADGLQQRMVGVSSHSSDTRGTNPLVYSGGLQRALWAAESIPALLLKRRGVDWNGFIKLSMSHDFTTTDSDIVFVPYMFAEDPALWWVLFHETGHIFVDDVLRKKTWLKNALEQRAFRDTPSQHADAPLLYAESFSERLASLFAFVDGFKCDWRLYLDANWHFILHWRPGLVDERRPRYMPVVDAILNEQVDRMLFVRLCIADESRLTESLFRDFVGECVQAIGGLGGKALLPRIQEMILNPSKMFAYFDQHASVALVEDHRFWKRVQHATGLHVRKTDVEANRKRLLATLRRAELGGPVSAPGDIVLGLLIRKLVHRKERGSIDSRSHLAPILAMWETYAHYLGQRLDKLAKS